METSTQVNAMRISAHFQPSLSQSRPATRIPTICVVDPKADDYQGWNATAEAKGARLLIVANADEALRLARTAAVDLWVVNTDLPGLSGCELCAMLKDRQPHAAVYVVVNEHTPEAERAAWQSGVTMFGCKGAHQAWLGQWIDRRQTASRRRSQAAPHWALLKN